jgi:hypothetical protein
MQLKNLLSETSKAQLQGYYLHWFPAKEMISARERLASELLEAMTDHLKVRQRFDALPRAPQAFLVSLLLRSGYSGTVEDVRGQKHGRAIEDFEVENILKGLQEAGYIVKTAGTGGYSREVFSIPEELGEALRGTISVEERQPVEMLSLRAFLGTLNGNASEFEGLIRPEEAKRRLEEIADGELKKLVGSALYDHGGVLPRSVAAHAGLLAGPPCATSSPAWRYELEAKRLGTTGILSLKDYGIDLEEEGLFVYQEIVYESGLEEATRGLPESDREISLGVDLIVDLDRALEVLRSEPMEVTREGNVYKKIEERIQGLFVTAQCPEFHDGSPVNHIIDLMRRLQLFDEEDHRIVVDPLRRRVWRKKPLMSKVGQVFEIYRGERRGQRWSFHQTAIREIFTDHLRTIAPGQWLVARPFLTAVVARYLLGLDERKVSGEFHDRCTGDFRNETLVVPPSKLYHDLSYWVLHRLALLGLVDVGYREGSFHALKLSKLGLRCLGVVKLEGSLPSTVEGSPAKELPAALVKEMGPVQEMGPAQGMGPVQEMGLVKEMGSVQEMGQVLVNPDYEILIYPDAVEEAVWMVSLFADRVDSNRVKRYRLTRESVKRGIVAGLEKEEIVTFLEKSAHGTIPHNVLYSLREWTEGVELVRRQKALLLRAQTPSGAELISKILEGHEVPYERLNETTIMVRGGKNERAVKDLQEHFRDHGLYVE